jgi:hypothetical protein
MRDGRRIVCGLLSAVVLISAFTVPPSAILPSSSSIGETGDSGSPLIGYWKFDEGVGNVTYDSSQGNYGLIHDGPNLTRNLWTNGIYNYSLQFDGVDNYVEVPDSSSLAVSGNITIMAWIRPAVNISDQVHLGDIVDKHGWINDNHTLAGGYMLEAAGDKGGKIGFSLYDSSGSLREVWSNETNPVQAGAWSHIAGTYNGNDLTLFVNGAIDNVTHVPGISIGTATCPLRIGTNSLNYSRDPFNGSIDEVRIYNTALAQDDIIRSAYVDLVEMQTRKNLTISRSGYSTIDYQIKVLSSTLANAYRQLLGVENMTGDSPIPIPEFRKVSSTFDVNETNAKLKWFNATEEWLRVRDDFLDSVVMELNSTYGLDFVVKNSSVTPHNAGEPIEVNINGYAPVQIAGVTYVPCTNRSRWDLVIGPIDDNASAVAAGLQGLRVYFLGEMLTTLKAVFNVTHAFLGVQTVRVKLPVESTLLDQQTIYNMRWHIDFGSGTYIEAGTSMEENSTIVMNERTVVSTVNSLNTTLDNFTAAYVGSHFGTLRINVTMPIRPSTPISPEAPDWSFTWDRNWRFTLWKKRLQVDLLESNTNTNVSLDIYSSFSQIGYVGFGVTGTASIRHGLSVDDVWFKAWLGFEADVDIETSVNATQSISRSWDKEIGTFETPIAGGFIFGLPIELALRVTVKAYCSMSATGQIYVQYTSKYSRSFKDGVEWHSSSGWTRLNESSSEWSKKGPFVNINANVSVEAGITGHAQVLVIVGIDISIAGIGVWADIEGGPYVDITLFGMGTFTVKDSEVASWELKIGLRVAVGATIGARIGAEFLWWKKSYGWEKEKQFGQWEYPFYDKNGEIKRHMESGDPIPEFSYMPLIPVGDGLDNVTFDASESTPDGGNISSYNWTFTSRETGTVFNKTGELAIFPFPRGGWWEVNLTVTDNDTRSAWVARWVYALKRDVAALNAAVSNFTYEDWEVKIDATVANVGETTESFDVYIVWEPIATNGTPANPPNTLVTMSLPANYSKTISWTTLAPSGLSDLGLYQIQVHVTQLAGEMNLTNNHLYDGGILVAMLGDINGDRKIDSTDISIIEALYGSVPGESGWNVYADLDRSSRVDYWDIFKVSRNFGKTY